MSELHSLAPPQARVAPSGELGFRLLGRGDIAAMIAIEEAIIEKNPDSVRLGHIHRRTPAQYEKLMASDSGSRFVGAFQSVEGGSKLLGYCAYVTKPPHAVRDLHIFNEQLVHLESQRHVSLPVARENPVGTAFFYSRRVDPACQNSGIGTEISKELIRASLGIGRSEDQARDRNADFSLGDVTVTNLLALRSQSRAGKKVGSTDLIWAAGYDAGADYVPCVTTMQTTQVNLADMPILHTANVRDVFGGHFAAFAQVLDSGYIAKIDFTGRNTSSWTVHFAKRPDHIQEVRALGEAAQTISPREMVELLTVPQADRPNRMRARPSLSLG